MIPLADKRYPNANKGFPDYRFKEEVNERQIKHLKQPSKPTASFNDSNRPFNENVKNYFFSRILLLHK